MLTAATGDDSLADFADSRGSDWCAANSALRNAAPYAAGHDYRLMGFREHNTDCS
jgi:hypothetical protein